MQKTMSYKFWRTQSHLIKFLSTLFLVISSVSYAGEKVNFSGEWSISPDKTNLGESGLNLAGSQIIIDQKDNDLSLTRFVTGMDGQEHKMAEKFTLDGKENKNIIFNNSPKTSTVTWAEDGKSFTIASNIMFNNNGDNMEIASNEVWKLSDDGNTLTIEFSSIAGWGEIKQVYVFDKKIPAK